MATALGVLLLALLSVRIGPGAANVLATGDETSRVERGAGVPMPTLGGGVIPSMSVEFPRTIASLSVTVALLPIAVELEIVPEVDPTFA
jgi:hypothetical protein